MGALISFLFASYYIPTLYFAEKPTVVSLRPRRKLTTDSEKPAEEVQVSLRSFVEARCPSLFKEFRPAWWLYTGHQQTGYCVVGDFSKIDKVEYDRTLLRTLDGGTLGIDFTPPESERLLPDDTPIIVVMHGLTGSHEAYVRAVLNPACTPKKHGGLGYRAVVVNFRGCADIPITSPQLYSAGHTDDLRVAVHYIQRRYPRAKLLGLGFSLGANVLTKYLAEEGDRSRFIAGCALANPWDSYRNSLNLEGRWLNRTLYSRGMATNLQALLRRHAKYWNSIADHPVGQGALKAISLQSPFLEDFDNAMTRVAGGSSPPFPMPTAHAYYKWASSANVLGDIRVPFLALNSDDDPIVREVPTEGGSGWVVVAITRGGGHLGWFEQGIGLFGVKRWFRRPVLEWLWAMESELIAEPSKAREVREVDGFWREEGRDDIGYQVLGGGGHVHGVDKEGGLFAGL